MLRRELSESGAVPVALATQALFHRGLTEKRYAFMD
jgi:hypothetical protein